MHGRYFYVPKCKGLLEILGRFMLVWGGDVPGIMEKWSKIEQRLRLSRSILQVAAKGISFRDMCFPKLAFQK